MSEQELDAQWLESSGEPTVQGLSPGLAPKKRPLAMTLKVKSCPVGRGSLYGPLLNPIGFFFLNPIVEFLSKLKSRELFPQGSSFLLDTTKRK